MTFHTEILGSRQARALQHLGPLLTPRGFYLAGGTALALHLGHRRSVDLDWFTGGPFEEPLRLVQRLREAGISFITEAVDSGTLHGTLSRVRVTLLEYGYPLLQPLHHWEEMNCQLAALLDLATMKLSALAQRGARKDFVDLYALVQSGLPLQQMLQAYRQRFGVQDLSHVLYSLVFFDDAEREPMPKMFWRIRWPAIKKAIRQWVHELAE
jgi:nucleotidyltransferase AbiEii toxin of type IV toxin-antitoxin system